MADKTHAAESSIAEADGIEVPRVLSSWRTQVLQRVGGFDNVIDALLSNLGLVLERDASAVRGIFLHGPPGSGKSHFASALSAAAAGAEAPDAPESVDIASAVAGATRELSDALATVTRRARMASKHSQVVILILEGAEALNAAGDDEGAGMSVDSRLVVFDLIISTVRRWREEALPALALMPWARAAPVPTELSASGVFEGRLTLPTPLGRGQRHAVLSVCVQSLPLGGSGSDREEILDIEADATAGFLPCDLSALCRGAALAAVRRCAADTSYAGSTSTRPCLTHEDFVAARLRMIPTPMRGAASYARPKSRAATKALQHGGDAGLAAVVGQSVAIKALQAWVVQPFKRLVAERAATEHMSDSIFAAAEPPLGVLLCGPPGAGKTHLAVQLASELGAHIFAAAPADILASRVGEAEKRMAALFEAARRCAPSAVILEDVDALIAAEDDDPSEAGAGSETRAGLVLRSELDTLRVRRMAHKKLREGGQRFPLASEALVLVIATACEKSCVAGWLLAPHRLSQTIELEPCLSAEAVAELLRRSLRDKVDDKACIAAAASSLCGAGKGNGAAAAAFCRAAATQAVRRHVSSLQRMGVRETVDQERARTYGLNITMEDMRTALEVV